MIHARGTVELFTVDLQGAVDGLIAAGGTDITLDLADVSSIDHAAAWCVAETSSATASRHPRLTTTRARDVGQAVPGDLRRAARCPIQGEPPWSVLTIRQLVRPTPARHRTTSPTHDPTEQNDHVTDEARTEEQADVMDRTSLRQPRT